MALSSEVKHVNSAHISLDIKNPVSLVIGMKKYSTLSERSTWYFEY